MGKQKDFRHVHHSSHKKKDKKIDKTSKPSRSSCHEGYLKNIEVVVQAELDSVANAKKIGRKERKELERFPLLSKAVFLGCERVVGSILEAGENVNVQVSDGSTPLIIAVENGYPGIVQKLLKKGADPKLLRQDGRNALMIAVSKNDNRSFTLIWHYWDKSNFWELNHSDSQGYSVLTIAVEHRDFQITEFLLSLNGIEIDKQTKDGRTPLMFAVAAGQANIVQKLLSSGSDVVLEDKNGATAICLAISHNRNEIKKLLLDCLDCKCRDLYVKKRIELLSRPRGEDYLTIITFYKDILFRVLLEIRRSFEDGVALLEKYKVFIGLLKCIDTHQQSTELLRIGFHLAVCLMYDKAEYSRYINEELAEQYISVKFADYSLKVMHNYRLKSMTDLRAAAYLSIHAGTQCRSGKVWLKANYFEVLSFLKDFKMVFPTLTFWADGESVKAKIMFDRFVEILHVVEKDIKMTQPISPEAKVATTEKNPVAESTEKSSTISSSELSVISTPDNQQWCLVSSSKSSSKTSCNPPQASVVTKNDVKKKNKKLKLQTKLQRKMTVKKLSQRPDFKYIPGLGGSFPALPSEKSFTQTGYADALKKNLKNEAILKESKEHIFSKEIDGFSTNKESWPNISLNCSSNKPEQSNIEPQKHGDSTHVVKENKVENSKENKKEKDQHFYDLWNNVSKSGDPVNLMTFVIKFCQLNAKNNDSANQSSQDQTSTPDAISLEHVTKECNEKQQNKNLFDTLASLGLKITSEPDSKCEPENTLINESENALKNEVKDESENTANNELKNAVSNECENAVRKEFENGSNDGMKKAKDHDSWNTTNESEIADGNGIANDIIYEVHDRPSSPSNMNEEISDVTNKAQNLKDKRDKVIETEESAELLLPKINELISAEESFSSSELNRSKILSENDILPLSSDNTNNNFIKSFKRKYAETYFQDFCFSFYKEEIKETAVLLNGNLQYYKDSCDIQNDIKSVFSGLRLTESYMLSDSKDKLNHNDIGSKLEVCNKNVSSPNISTALLNTRKSIKHFSNKASNQFPLNRIAIGTRNIIPSANDKSYTILDEGKISFDLLINGLYSNFYLKSSKCRQNSKYSLSNCTLSLTGTQIMPGIKFSNLQKILLMYQRLIFYQDVCTLRMFVCKSQPRLPRRNFDYPSACGCVKQYKSIRNFEYCQNSLTIHKKDSMLVKFKSEFRNFLSAAILYTTSKIRKHSWTISRRGIIRASKNSDNERRHLNSKPTNATKEDRRNTARDMFSSNRYGYKPQFINCETRSQWYKILHRIESCVPLASFLFGFREPGRSLTTDCTIHELICSSGKITFSSKEEHVLRRGEYGTYLGLMSNGDPVVVRKFQNSSHEIVELLSKKNCVVHKNIATFYCVCSSPTDQSIFAITELIEYSLSEYLKTKSVHFDGKLLVQELVEAVKYLHKKRIVHGYLKPSNVMVTIDHRLKVSGFYQLDVTPLLHGIVRRQDVAPIASSLPDYCWRPYELIAAATGKDARKYLTTASDIQMTGMLIYYILSGGKHPFGSSELQCQENIRSGFPEFSSILTDIESRDLIRDMIKKIPVTRLSIDLVTKHPYLWSSERRFEFLVAVSRKISFFTRKPTKIAETLQDSCIEARDWTCYIHNKIVKYVGKSVNKNYGNGYADLLHFLVSINDCFETMPPEIKSFIQHLPLFISRAFPTIFMSVYCVVRDNPCVQRQMALQAFF